MVSTRRKIVSEQDRFGGYSRQPSARVSIDDAKDEYSINSSMDLAQDYPEIDAPVRGENLGHIYANVRRVPTLKRTENNIVEYSTLANPATKEFAEVVTAPKKQTLRREREDLMPSIKTRAYNKDEQEVEPSVSRKTNVKISTKSKALLAVYMIVVVILAVMVIATGIVVSNINNEVSSLEGELLARNQQVVMQNSVIDKITDQNYIAGVAMGNEMIKVDTVVSVDKLPIVDSIKYESRTNWFDKISDWLSKIIGG